LLREGKEGGSDEDEMKEGGKEGKRVREIM
jgi:hypothetical protein